MKNALGNLVTFVASAAVGCGASIALAGAAAVTREAPNPRLVPKAAPIEVVRLEPITVTVSKQHYEAVRRQIQLEQEIAAEAARTKRG